MTTALAIYGTALRRAALGEPSPLHLLDDSGRPVWRSDAGHWSAGLRPGDHGMIRRCAGATVDLGCGPGRLIAALRTAGLPALGVDISAEAVRQVRRRGASAVHGCLFNRLPSEGRWRHVLLADGNVGIGGDPVRLLTRCAEILAPGGDVLVEVDAPGSATWSGVVRLGAGTRISTPFPWAAVAMDALDAVATRAAMSVLEQWTEAGRWFARLTSD